jgi:hypothetical protein
MARPEPFSHWIVKGATASMVTRPRSSPQAVGAPVAGARNRRATPFDRFHLRDATQDRRGPLLCLLSRG